jgi:hypothetical protein
MIFTRLKGYLHWYLMSNTVLVCNQKGYLVKFGKFVKLCRNTQIKKYKATYTHIAP